MEWSIILAQVRAPMVVLGIFLSVAALSTARSAKDEDPMLTATLTSDRTAYSLADNIRLDFRLTNSGKSPLSLFGELLWGHAGGLVLRITDMSNNEIPAKALDDDMVVPATLEDRNSFVVLNPRHYLGTTRLEHLSEIVEKPGTYFIQIEYISPVPGEFGQGPNFWGREKPPVWSNKIEVHVTAK